MAAALLDGLKFLIKRCLQSKTLWIWIKPTCSCYPVEYFCHSLCWYAYPSHAWLTWWYLGRAECSFLWVWSNYATCTATLPLSGPESYIIVKNSIKMSQLVDKPDNTFAHVPVSLWNPSLSVQHNHWDPQIESHNPPICTHTPVIITIVNYRTALLQVIVITMCSGGPWVPGAGLGHCSCSTSNWALVSSFNLEARSSHTCFSEVVRDFHSDPTIREMSPNLDSGLFCTTCLRTSLEYRMYPVTTLFLVGFY